MHSITISPLKDISVPKVTVRGRVVRRQGPGNEVALTVDGVAVDGDVVAPPPLGTERVVVGGGALVGSGGAGEACLR